MTPAGARSKFSHGPAAVLPRPGRGRRAHAERGEGRHLGAARAMRTLAPDADPEGSARLPEEHERLENFSDRELTEYAIRSRLLE